MVPFRNEPVHRILPVGNRGPSIRTHLDGRETRREAMNMACPMCGSKQFYVKDPSDAYDTYAFDLEAAGIVFSEDVDEEACPEVTGETETYCSRCAWHGRFGELGKGCRD